MPRQTYRPSRKQEVVPLIEGRNNWLTKRSATVGPNPHRSDDIVINRYRYERAFLVVMPPRFVKLDCQCWDTFGWPLHNDIIFIHRSVNSSPSFNSLKPARSVALMLGCKEFLISFFNQVTVPA